VCWLCSDQVAWWREARIRAGLGAEPPNEPRYHAGFKPPAPAIVEREVEHWVAYSDRYNEGRLPMRIQENVRIGLQIGTYEISERWERLGIGG
jgi:hypothetical protein